MVMHQSIAALHSLNTKGHIFLLRWRRPYIAEHFFIVLLLHISEGRWLRFVFSFLLSIPWVIYLGNTPYRDSSDSALGYYSSTSECVGFNRCCSCLSSSLILYWSFLCLHWSIHNHLLLRLRRISLLNVKFSIISSIITCCQ